MLADFWRVSTRRLDAPTWVTGKLRLLDVRLKTAGAIELPESAALTEVEALPLW